MNPRLDHKCSSSAILGQPSAVTFLYKCIFNFISFYFKDFFSTRILFSDYKFHIQVFFVSRHFFIFILTNFRILVSLVSLSGDNFLINVVGSLGLKGLGTPKPSKRWTQWSTRPASCYGRLDQHRRCRYNLFQVWHHRTYGGVYPTKYSFRWVATSKYTHKNWTHLAPWELHGQA